jgi:hypothetical protein
MIMVGARVPADTRSWRYGQRRASQGVPTGTGRDVGTITHSKASSAPTTRGLVSTRTHAQAHTRSAATGKPRMPSARLGSASDMLALVLSDLDRGYPPGDRVARCYRDGSPPAKCKFWGLSENVVQFHVER